MKGGIIKRGRVEVELGTKGLLNSVRLILNATKEKDIRASDIYKFFTPGSVRYVKRLIARLIDCRLLIPIRRPSATIEGREDNLDIFYWDFQGRTNSVTKKLNSHHVVIVGVNFISRQLVTALHSAGVHNFTIVDHPSLRNFRLFDKAGKLLAKDWPGYLHSPEKWTGTLDPSGLGCLVPTSDLGDSSVFHEFNALCVNSGRHFLPVLLKNLVGYVGPFVVPGETACFECLQARQNSHLKSPELVRAVEESVFDRQQVVGFHPSMATVLGDIAAMELTKFYSGVLPSWNIGTLIEVDLLDIRVTGHRVLRIPRCPICSCMNAQASTAPEKTIFVSLDRSE